MRSRFILLDCNMYNVYIMYAKLPYFIIKLFKLYYMYCISFTLIMLPNIVRFRVGALLNRKLSEYHGPL